jgi:hypothetical protein
MKNIKLIYGFIVVFGLSSIALSCSDDEEKASAGFAGISSSYQEKDGEVTITIPFVNGSVSESDIVIDGSATAGEDYELLAITEEGVSIKLFDDNDCEKVERIRLTITNASGEVNRMHTVTIASDFSEGTTEDLSGTYILKTDDWQDFTVGAEVQVQRVDDTHIRVVGYPATTFNHADMAISITDLRSGAAVVESQNSGSYNASGTQQTTTSGTGSVNGCSGIIDLNLKFVLPCCGTLANQHFVLEKKK